MMNDQQPPGAPGPQPAPPAEEGGYDIVIHVGPNREIKSVGVNRPGEEPQPPMEFMNRGISDTLHMVRGIIESDGEIHHGVGDDRQDMEEAMVGYGRGGLRGLPVNKVLRSDR